VTAAVAAVPGAQLISDPAAMGALLAAGVPAGWLVRCGHASAPPLLALLPASYPSVPPLAVSDGATLAAVGGAAAAGERAALLDALRAAAPTASLAALVAAWHATVRASRAHAAAAAPPLARPAAAASRAAATPAS
jgi:hypothetical protein